MTLLTWGYTCAVGVRAMDDQHGILMDTLNELRLAGVQGRGREEQNQILDRLIAYSRTHFASEEQLMEQTGFPDLAAHRHVHRQLLAEILHVAHQLQRGDKPAFQPLFCRLRDSYIEHIEGPDSKYGAWMNAHGVI